MRLSLQENSGVLPCEAKAQRPSLIAAFALCTVSMKNCIGICDCLLSNQKGNPSHFHSIVSYIILV